MGRFTDTMHLFRDLVSRADADINLPAASFAYARVEDPDLRVETWIAALDRLSDDVAESVDRRAPASSSHDARLQALVDVMFDELGFTGNANDYYDPANSCLNYVLETRIGLPITLSVVYMAFAARCGRETEGVGFPSHFLVRDVQTGILLDPFGGGRRVSKPDLEAILESQANKPVEWSDDFLAAVGKRQILERMLTNLRYTYSMRRNDPEKVQEVDALLGVLNEVTERGTDTLVQ